MAPRKPPRPRPRRTRHTADEEVTGEDADDVVKISQQESNEQPEGVPQEEQEVWDSIREEQYEGTLAIRHPVQSAHRPYCSD